jgi:adenylylsulfate kinase
LGFSKEDRDENVRRIGFVAGLLTNHGVVALVAAIAPYRATREEVAARIGAFLEVFVDAPLAVCEQRDPKGLYRKARSGELRQLTGVDAPYWLPLKPAVTCRTDVETVAESAMRVVDEIMKSIRVTL